MAKVETERFFGKKGIIIMIRDGNKIVSAIFKDKKNADKFNRNKPADVKKLLQLAKKTKYPKAIDEDTDVGHEDDEPNMLKSTALEIMEYGKKLMDKLDKYDDMDGEVDFPNWWQSKLTLAKDYVQKAYHYLDSEEKTSETIDRSFRYDGYEDDEGPVDEAFLVAYGKREGNKSIKPAFAAYADKKLAQKFMADMKKDGYKVMMTQKKIRGIDESVKEGSMDWEKNFKGYNEKELKVISKFIWMNPKGIDGVIKMSKHKPFAFRRTIQKMAKKGLHEASKEAMGIAGFTGTRGVAVDDFIKKNKIDARKLFNFVRKGNLRDRMDFVTAIAGKPNNKFFKMIVGRFAESVNEKRGFVTKMLNKKLTIKRIGSRERFKDTKSGKVFKKDGFAFHIPGKGYIGYRDEKGMPYTPGGGKKALQQILDDGGFLDYKKLVLINPVDESVNEDKNQIVQLKKKVGKSEIKFYDALSKIEKKLGKKKYRAFLEKGLKDFKINAKHYDYRSNGAAEEKLFNLAK